MNSRENVKKTVLCLGIVLSVFGSIGNQMGLIIIGGGLALIGTILLIK